MSVRAFGDVYAGRRVLVTGHTGFKGSWLCLWLTELGARVTGYALDPPTEPNLFGTLSLGDLVEDVRGDVRDHDRLVAVVRKSSPDLVYHLAAQPLVREGYREPRTTFATNVMGTVEVCEAVRAARAAGLTGPRVLVVVTSDKCYEERDSSHAHREDDPLGGRDPYSASKACQEIVAAAYRASFLDETVRVATARAGNVIGGGDWAADRLIPDCVRAVSAGEAVVVRNPRAIRPWQHVLESLSGYLWLGAGLWSAAQPETARLAGAWNCGPREPSPVPVARVVDLFHAELGRGERKSPADDGGQPHEAAELVLDVTKAESELGWKPTWDIERAVRVTAAWYADYLEGGDTADMLKRSVEDIRGYTADACSLGLPWACIREEAHDAQH